MQTMIQIYPTLIDSFNYYIGSEQMTLQEMLDRINRVPTPMPEAALQGTALNNLVDAIIKGEKIIPKLIKVKGQDTKVYEWRQEYESMGEKMAANFTFNREVVDELAGNLTGAAFQVFSEGTIKTSYGPVRLYGFLDYVIQDKAIDLKSTKRYTWPKFQNNFQHRCYLYTLREEGIEIEQFQYLVTDFKEVYKEDYFWSRNLKQSILPDLERFLEFLDRHQAQITDQKVLGLASFT